MIACTFENGNQASLRHVTVGCLLIKDNQILLVKRAEGLLEAGKWCLPGGFMERGETAEQAMARETLEESGWSMTNIRLFRINDSPERPHEDRQNIDFLYIANAATSTDAHDWETTALEWFSLTALPPEETVAFDHFDTIKLYKDYLETPFALPKTGPL